MAIRITVRKNVSGKRAEVYRMFVDEEGNEEFSVKVAEALIKGSANKEVEDRDGTEVQGHNV